MRHKLHGALGAVTLRPLREDDIGFIRILHNQNKNCFLYSIDECLEKGWTGMGFKTVDFEERWKEYTGHP